jgi:hypothetical protein
MVNIIFNINCSRIYFLYNMYYTEIKLHQSKEIINWDGMCYDNKVLDEIKINDVVRISIFVSNNSKKNDWIYDHDSPFVKILTENNNLYLGEILNINRFDDNIKYPINTGDKIWFSLNNIIEISTEMNPHKKLILDKYLIKNKFVSVTGPLYTIKYDDSDNDSDNNSDYSSINSSDTDSDTNTDSDYSSESSEDSESESSDSDTNISNINVSDTNVSDSEDSDAESDNEKKYFSNKK